MKWIVERAPRQLGGKGSDYGAWLVGRNERGAGQFISIQIGQCGDEPEGDAMAAEICAAMLDGLNRRG